jgi:hypothetical protein
MTDAEPGYRHTPVMQGSSCCTPAHDDQKEQWVMPDLHCSFDFALLQIASANPVYALAVEGCKRVRSLSSQASVDSYSCCARSNNPIRATGG